MPFLFPLPGMSFKRLLYLTGHLLAILLLTALTQTGGIVWLVSLLVCRWAARKRYPRGLPFIGKLGVFIGLYLVCTLVLVPLSAPLGGRVPLPLFHARLQPLAIGTVLLNRHYVRKELRQAAFDLSEKMATKYPGTVTLYLDAGFPFLNGFPLLPHLSHNNGRKMDLAFYYQDAVTRRPVSDAPSPIGYGICEEPRAGEENMAAYCVQRGFWQYSLLQTIIPQGNKRRFRLDEQRTRAALTILASNPHIGKIFIEPHLKQRLKLTAYAKIRFQGCQAVRHDDHIHIQL